MKKLNYEAPEALELLLSNGMNLLLNLSVDTIVIEDFEGDELLDLL